jgi:hypothetical protein
LFLNDLDFTVLTRLFDDVFDFTMTISLTRLFDENKAVETLVFHNGYLYEETKA